jgi:hypothetical protein
LIQNLSFFRLKQPGDKAKEKQRIIKKSHFDFSSTVAKSCMRLEKNKRERERERERERKV